MDRVSKAIAETHEQVYKAFMSTGYELEKKLQLTAVQCRLLRRMVRHNAPLSRLSISPADVRTGRRLVAKGLAIYPDDCCFRLTDEGREQARIHGLG